MLVNLIGGRSDKYNFKEFYSSIGYQKSMNVYFEYVQSMA